MFSASPDASIRVWGVQQAQCGQIVRTHEGPVTGLSLHATGDYLLSSSTDGVRYVQKFYFNFYHFFHILCLRVVKNGLQSTSPMSIIILMKRLISIYISLRWLIYPCNPFIYSLMLLPAHSSMYVCTRMSTTILEHQSVKKRWSLIAWLKFRERPCNWLIYKFLVCVVIVSLFVNFIILWYFSSGHFRTYRLVKCWWECLLATLQIMVRLNWPPLPANFILLLFNLTQSYIMFHYVSVSFLAKFIGIKQKVLLNFQTLLRDSSCMSTIKRFSLSVAMLKESVRPASKLVCMAFLNVCVFA